ncbi:tarsal-less isoform 4A [Bombyx mori]|uniref:Tal-like protein 4A n=1 Tax=Bombyx mori TaxID=7091 RepID=A3RLR5_BOMMO|nr:tarsal-less isoform 4A [Bombyx mori]ABO09848.1 tal-like protein 4A [Bombyx mori]
MTGLDPTEVY